MRDYGQRKHVVKGGLKLKRRIIFPFGASALIVFKIILPIRPVTLSVFQGVRDSAWPNKFLDHLYA
jgi:hypothetical protein